MAKALDDLVALLALERIEENLFRGQSQDLGWGTVFGGQVLGQALSAAVQTVPPDRHVHSLHAYFLRPGDVARPIVYDVDRIRDGRGFTTRRVVAIQGGEAIFNMAASFQIAEPGFEHQDVMPRGAGAGDAADRSKSASAPSSPGCRPAARERARRAPLRDAPDRSPSTDPSPACAARARATGVVRAVGTAGRRPGACIATSSPTLRLHLHDHGAGAARRLLAHARHAAGVLDHVMWFHRRSACDEWLLHVIDSPAHGAPAAWCAGRCSPRTAGWSLRPRRRG